METFPWWDLRHISLSWGLREEDIESCAARLARYLVNLQSLHPAMIGLRSSYGSRELLYPLTTRSKDYVPLFTRLIESVQPKRRCYPDGFHFRAHCKFGTSRFLLLYVVTGVGRDGHEPVGGSSQFCMNYVGFSTVVTDVRGEDVPTLDSLKSILLAGIDAWNPDCGGLFSHHYKQLTHDPSKWGPYSQGSWAVYLARDLAAQISPPPDCQNERVAGDGLLMMATSNYFSHKDIEKRAKAEAIHKAVAPLGL